MHNC